MPNTTYSLTWRQWKKPKQSWQEPTELEVKTRTFASREAREKFMENLQMRDKFYDITDVLTETV